MAFYWRLDSIPELRGMPRDSRREWWREAVAQTRTRTDQLLLVLSIAGSVIVTRVVAHAWHWSGVEHVAATVVLAGVCGWALQASGQPRARRWLAANLTPGGLRRPWLTR